jgi:hypothetical protein
MTSSETFRGFVTRQNIVGWTYELAWFFIGAAVIALASAAKRGQLPLSWRLAWVPISICLLAMPMLFGTYLHPTLYPAAAISWKVAEHQHQACGVLVGDQEKTSLLWLQDGGYGVMLNLREHEIVGLATGPVVSLLAIRIVPNSADGHILAEACKVLTQQLLQ